MSAVPQGGIAMGPRVDNARLSRWMATAAQGADDQPMIVGDDDGAQ
jgi:hypothetical protein